jgi:Mor family transcriptional regulator
MSQEKIERNKALYNDHIAGASIVDLVAKYRINSSAIIKIIKRYEKFDDAVPSLESEDTI